MLFKNSGEALFFLLAVFWYISIPVGCALIYLGIRWMLHTRFLGLKIAAFVLPLIGFILIWAGAAGLTQMIKDKNEDHRLAQLYKAHTQLLKDSATVAGIRLAPGTRVYYEYNVDMQHTDTAKLSDISSFELSAPAKILGVTVCKSFSTINGGWETYLPFDQKIDSLPVAKGKVQLTEKGRLKEGYASKSFSLFDQKIPKGALMSLWTYGENIYYIGTDSSSFTINRETGEIEKFN